MKALVCLPTKNEIGCVAQMIEEIKTLHLDLIVCDSNSNDGTIEAAEKLQIEVFQRDGEGKGYGVQKALQVAEDRNYSHLVLLDCDYSYPVSSIPKLIEKADQSEMVVGYREMKDIAFHRRLANLFFTGMVNLLFGGHYKDVNSGMRVLNVKKFRPILNASNFDIEAQISCQALKRKYRTVELPIQYEVRIGKSKIRLKDAIEIFRRVLIERFYQ